MKVKFESLFPSYETIFELNFEQYYLVSFSIPHCCIILYTVSTKVLTKTCLNISPNPTWSLSRIRVLPVTPPRRNFLWGLALADVRAALKTLPCTCRLTFPSLWSMSLPLAPSLRVLLSLSHRTPQDGEVSTSLSEITSTAPLYLWGSRAALCSAGISRRSKSKLNEYNSSRREEIYIGLLYTTTLHYSNRCGNT